MEIKQTIHVICLLLICACSGCFKEDTPTAEAEVVKDANGVITDKPFLWKKDVSEKGLIWTTVSPAVYENTVVVGGATSFEKDMLVALDLNTGEEVWRWTDFLTYDHGAGINSGESSEYSQKDNIWILQDSYYFYALNLQNGTTLWKEKIPGSPGNAEIQIIDNNYYHSFGFFKDSTEVPTLVRGDIYSPQYTKIVSPPIDSIQHFTSFYGGMGIPYVYEGNGQLYAFLQFSENVNLNESQSFSYVASYNLSTNSYDFEKTRLGGDTNAFSFSQRPAMYQDIMVVNPDGTLYGVNKHTGDVAWHLEDFQQNGDGVFTYAVYEDKLFAVNKLGSTNRVMALDPLTGRTLWEDIGHGGSVESIHFLNGVLYFSSRGDGHVYAYDADNGKLLWNLKSPEYESFQGFGGFRVVPGKDGEKGKAIACTYATAYCFEAER